MSYFILARTTDKRIGDMNNKCSVFRAVYSSVIHPYRAYFFTAFVGNSFPPVVKGGGQNLLQPLAHGKPVLFGPKTATIRSEVTLATQAGVGFEVRNAEELAQIGIRLLSNIGEREEISTKARNLIRLHRGVSHRYAEAVVASARSVIGERT